MPGVLVLRRPRADEEDEFMRAHLATTPEVPSFLHYYEDGIALSRYIEVLEERERGVNLPPNHVPSTFLFAFNDERIVGRVAIRHKLNAILQRVGGHIGYVVVPEFRRQGYATAILRLALQFAHNNLGLDHVLVTCDDDTIGSIKTIEHNGGVLESVISGPDLDKPKRRYWIDARRGAEWGFSIRRRAGTSLGTAYSRSPPRQDCGVSICPVGVHPGPVTRSAGSSGL